MFSMAMWMAALVAPVQLLAGDAHGFNTLAHQPAKVLAMEGDYDPSPHGAPLILFGLPDDHAGRMRDTVEIPGLGSLILRHDANAPLPGLNSFARQDRPPVRIVLWSFRLMVGLGLLMFALGLASLAARLRGKLYDWRALHIFAVAMGPAGFVAVTAGWITTEVGRQPWVIYGLLRTEDSVSPVGVPGVAGSLIAFVIVYFAVFAAGIAYLLRLIAAPPHSGEGDPGGGPIRTAGITPAASVEKEEAR